MTDTALPTDFEVRPVTTVIGAEVHGVDLAAPLDAAVVAEIDRALVQWKVLFFRDQRITQDQQVAFARNFGELTPAHPVHAPLEGHPEIYSVEAKQLKVSQAQVTERPTYASPRSTQTGWHTDITFVPNPALGSILRGVVIPTHGGDTMWSNLVAAYEDLGAPIRELIDGSAGGAPLARLRRPARARRPRRKRAAALGRAPRRARPPRER